ncbi:hypothetical protein BBK36DRAFT_1128308 [Trichoderma citrinoviride]|uniref:FAD/NAD(P)-binding domain-containing protein n=1 Tax=Trichoderma citrinoviride TaxID=58853 RepID=A0A2T4B0M5_9HYPO|nr:hypothetical protein BBK36DRAFT_1128308 [Trichoderma citrinoviride]PTB62781.1 hypothetical protein BBK36DRAFT_1128308 [Trichoderma citrinoviride]
MEAFDALKSQFGAHIVTRPNPDIVGANKDQLSTSSAQLLQYASKAWTTLRLDPFSSSNKAPGPESRKVLLQSFSDIDEKDGSLVSYNNGFVDGIIRAFQQDLHLVLRPDDVWLATMVQFSFYVNGHAEEMRRFFVNHEGKKQLVVDTGASSPLSVDFSEIAQAFKDLIQANVVDAELTSWILPNFSTTTSEDITTTTLVMMATTKAYFEFIARGGCGFPSVTLLGVRADWVKLLEKVAKIAIYGGDLAVWSRLLTKVVEKMIKTFDQPDLQTTKDFWMRAVHHAGAEGSGSIETLSGWITAFCRWDEEGRMIKQVDEAGKTWDGKHVDRKRFVIDDVPFPIIRAKDVPRAATEVPVTVLDHEADICYHTTAIAGLIGVKPTASEEGGPHDTFQPRCYPGFIADGPVGLFDFSDLPMSEVVGLKNWDELPGIKVHEYLHEYARKFHLLERCKFSCRVTHIRRSPSEKGWTVETQTTSPHGKPVSESLDCDKLIVATGNFNNPKYPDVKSSEFSGLVLHTKDIGQQHEALLGKDVETVAIYGGGKSAIDAVNLCIEAGKKVHWIISDKGNGPNMLFNTRLKWGFHVGQFVGRWKDVFSVSIFSVDTFFGRFFYSGKNRLGTWLIGKFWAFAAKKTRSGAVYAGMTDENREKLLPEGDSALFSPVGGAALHSCPKFIPELSKPDGLITVHRARITTAQDQTVHLSNGETIPCQALVFGTGWTPEDMLFEPAQGLSLGLRKPTALEDANSTQYWKKLHERADQDILSLLPILKDSPGPRTPDPLTPYRLYRYMLPSSLAAANDRSLIFLGYLVSIQTHILSEVSALWAICWLENLVELGIPKSKEDIDYEIAKVNAYSLRKNLSQEPSAGSGIQHFIDLLMKDMGLKAKRKGGLGVKDVFVPYRSQDYLGIVDDVLHRSKV